MTDKENEILWSKYFYPETSVLINNFGITDQKKLKEVEATITFEKLLELNKKPLEMGFDKEHLKALHKFVFGEIYPFAGDYRFVNIIKEKGSFLSIKDDKTIPDYLDYIFDEVRKKLDQSQTKYDFAYALAYLYTNLIYCHPFREGNGRVIREFVREFTLAKGQNKFELDWRLIPPEELNKNIEVAHMFPGETALLFYEALVPIKSKNI